MRLGETCFDAVRREVLEETGIEVRPIKTLTHVDAIYRDDDSTIRYHYVILYIEAEHTGGEQMPGDDAEDARWFTLQKLEGLNLENETLRILRSIRRK